MGIFGVYSCVNFMLGGGSDGATVLLNIFMGILIYFMCGLLTQKQTRTIFKTVVLVCVLNGVWMVVQYLDFDFIFKLRGPNNTILNEPMDLVGFLGIKSVVGMWMGMGLLSALMSIPLLSLVFLVPIYISRSSGVILGLIFAIPFYFWYNRSILQGLLYRIRIRVSTKVAYWLFMAVILAGSVGYVVFIDSPMGMMGTRPPMWKMVCGDVVYGRGEGSRYLRNPILGFGLDSFRVGRLKYYLKSGTNETIRVVPNGNTLVADDGNPLYAKDGGLYTSDKIVFKQGDTLFGAMQEDKGDTKVFITPKETVEVKSNDILKIEEGRRLDLWDDPHNEVIHLFYQLGLVGVFIFFMVVYHMVRRFNNSIKTDEVIIVTAMLIFLFCASMTQFNAHLARIGYMYPVLLGLFIGNTKQEEIG